MATTLQQLLKAPNLPQLVSEAKAHLEEEAGLREQFYKDMDESTKAEFINGRIVVHSPASKRHNKARKWLMKLMDTFVERFGYGEVYDEKAMVHLSRNSVEPDIAFWEAGKAALFEDDQMIFPAPDMVVEVLSKSTEKNDRKIKFEDYALHNVREYWLIDTKQETVEQYLLPEGKSKYDLHRKAGIGDTIESVCIPGFKIPVKAIFDAETNLETLRYFMRE